MCKPVTPPEKRSSKRPWKKANTPGLDLPEISRKTVKIIIRSISIPFNIDEENILPLINIKMVDTDQISRVSINSFRSKNLIADPPSI